MSRLETHPPQNPGVLLNLWKPRGSRADGTARAGHSNAARPLLIAVRLWAMRMQVEHRSIGLQRSHPMQWWTALLLCSAVGGCNSAQPDRPSAVDSSAREQIGQLIGKGHCKKDADCRTLAIGLKACGGPEAYLAWSTANTDEPVLMAAAQRYANARRLQLDKPGAPASNCAVVSDPGAHCVASTDEGTEAPPSASATPVAPRHCALRSTGGAGGRAAD